MIPTVSERKASAPRARAGTTTQADIPDDLRTYLEGQGMTIRSALVQNGCQIVKVGRGSFLKVSQRSVVLYVRVPE